MTGTHRVVIENRRVRYDFEVRRNITLIRGDSATGKTVLVDMIREYDEYGPSSGIDLQCDRPCHVLEGKTWEAQLGLIRGSIVFIDEGNAFVHSDAFARKALARDNYYVIVSRENIPSLSSGEEEICGIRRSVRAGTSRVNNEFFPIK